MENLLDIDFDGGAPASASTPSNDPFGAADSTETSRVASPISGLSANPGGIQQPANNLDDLLGVFGSDGSVQNGGGSGIAGGSEMDILGGFGGMSLGGTTSPPPQQGQQQKGQMKNEDILGLF